MNSIFMIFYQDLKNIKRVKRNSCRYWGMINALLNAVDIPTRLTAVTDFQDPIEFSTRPHFKFQKPRKAGYWLRGDYILFNINTNGIDV